MNEDRKMFKWGLVIVPVVAAALAIYPPDRKLKAGIDLAGGSSLLFEIDTAGLDSQEKSGLAEQVMEVLKRRVDPNGQLNLIWRPIGNNRLEIQMPRPPKAALQRRGEWKEARDAIVALNLDRRDVQGLLTFDSEQRRIAKDAMIHGFDQRSAAFDKLIAAFDRRIEAEASDDFEAARSARDDYQAALDELMATSLNLGRLEDVLSLQSEETRLAEIESLKAAFPSEAYRSAIDGAVVAYSAWAKDKGVLEDPSDLKRRIRGAGVLEFRILAERNAQDPSMTDHTESYLRESISRYQEQLEKRGPRPRPGDRYRWFEVAEIQGFTNLDNVDQVEASKETMQVIVEKYAGKWYTLAHAEEKFGLLREQRWKLQNASPSIDPNSGRPNVLFGLDPRGGNIFARLTSENLQRPLCIMLDNEAQSFANINSMIRQNGVIQGDFSQDEARELVATLRAGSLPARLIETPLMEHTVGPSLGETNRRMGTSAAIYGGIAVAIFMLVYYRFAGLVACVALALNLLFVLGLMALTQATFTLPGIAGLILTVGMAVDANVLIFERVREELDRGVALRKSLRTGYDRALSTIVDANVTTLITCVILGYLGTEEVKGFAMVLGYGIVTSMFTALFVTRLVFSTLIDKGMLTALNMMRMMQKPNVDWLSLRSVFWPVSVVVVGLSLAMTITTASADRASLFDIEFLGGTSVQLDMKEGAGVTDETVRQSISSEDAANGSAVTWLRSAADKLVGAQVSQGSSSSSFLLSAEGLTSEELEALSREVLEPDAERGGFVRRGHDLEVVTDPEAGHTIETIKTKLALSADKARAASDHLRNARIQSVQSIDDAGKESQAFEVITVVTNKELVRAAILAVMGDQLNVERALDFSVVTDEAAAPLGYWPIDEDHEILSDVVGAEGGTYDIRNFKGGAAFVFDSITPPISIAEFERRLREIRLLPEFAQFDTRPFRAFGLTAAKAGGSETTYSKVAYVVYDANLPYFEDPGNWEEFLAKPELSQLTEALSTEKSLRKVNQFAPQVANQTKQQASVAIVMALAAIVAYIWIRFGQMQYGLAAIVALVHDVCVTLGLLTLAHLLHATFIGKALGLMDFKIDLPMIAAFLTLIGYGLNDTIVIFDRIRENRGKVRDLNPNVINNSINQCLSRTVLTSTTTMLAVLIMYMFGGVGIHGFSYAMICGVVVGTYSTVGVAAPLLHRPKTLNIVVFIMVALGALGIYSVAVDDIMSNVAMTAIVGVVVLGGLAWAIMRELRGGRSGSAAGTV